MIREAALITTSCVLFIQMGLSGEIQERLGVQSRVLSCPKCMTFWSVLAWMLCARAGLVLSVAASFICAYAALWAALILDGLTALYNHLYDTITKTTDTSETPEAQPGDHDQEADTDEVS